MCAVAGVKPIIPAGGWSRTINSGVADSFRSVANLNGEAMVVGLYNGSASETVNEGMVARYTNAGTRSYAKKYDGGSGNDAGFLSIAENSGVLAIAGYDLSGANDDAAIVARITTSTGALTWQRRITGAASSSTYGYGVAVDSSLNVYTTLLSTSGGNALYLVKYNSSGTLQWQRKLSASGGSPKVAASDFTLNVFYTTGTGVVSYDSTGAIQWQKALGANIAGIRADPNSAYIAVCGHDSSASPIKGVVIVLNGSTGGISWQRTIHDGSSIYLNDVCFDGLGNVYVVGLDSTTRTVVLKYSNSGVLQWQRSIGVSSFNVKGTGVAHDGDLGVFVVGASSQSTQTAIITKIKDDGTGTGTLGGYTYASTSYTEAAGAYSSTNSAYTDSAGGLTDSAGTLTSLGDVT